MKARFLIPLFAFLALALGYQNCGRGFKLSETGVDSESPESPRPTPAPLPFNFLTSALGIDIVANQTTTAELSPCPPGTTGLDKDHFVLVGTANVKEAVKITGGTCLSGANFGTLTFTTTNTYARDAFLASASMGLQEEGNTILAKGGGTLSVPSGVVKVSAPMTFNGAGKAVGLMISLKSDSVIEFPDGMVGDGITIMGDLNGTRMIDSGIVGGKIWAGSNTNTITGSLVFIIAVNNVLVKATEIRGGKFAGVFMKRVDKAEVAGSFFAHNLFDVICSTYPVMRVLTTLGEACYNIHVHDNKFSDKLDPGGTAVHTADLGANWIIENNEFNNLIGNGIINKVENSGFKILNNKFNSNMGSIDIKLDASNSSVMGNVFTGRTVGATLNNEGSNQTITGNTFSNISLLNALSTYFGSNYTIANNTCTNVVSTTSFFFGPNSTGNVVQNNLGCN